MNDFDYLTLNEQFLISQHVKHSGKISDKWVITQGFKFHLNRERVNLGMTATFHGWTYVGSVGT